MLKKADIGVGLYLLAAVVFFIVPIPSVLLDVMLAFNISIALIIVFNVLFVREVLDMSFFPTLLLFTTIFRISLNVSSTRLILLTGDPGNVVKTFGSFVGGGNMVVGSIPTDTFAPKIEPSNSACLRLKAFQLGYENG